jgi:hypothetical protein
MEPIAIYIARQDMTKVAHSALPDAPVVPYLGTARLRRTRTTVASALQRLATVVTPAERCVVANS